MCIRAYVYACMCYVCVCVYVYVHRCVCVYGYVYMYLCMYVCVCVCIYVCMYVWVCMCLYVCICVCLWICVYVSMYVCICVYVNVCVYAFYVCVYYDVLTVYGNCCSVDLCTFHCILHAASGVAQWKIASNTSVSTCKCWWCDTQQRVLFPVIRSALKDLHMYTVNTIWYDLQDHDFHSVELTDLCFITLYVIYYTQYINRILIHWSSSM